MEEKEYKRRFEEYKEKIKKQKDRELIESIALKLKYVELDIEELREDLINSHNRILYFLKNFLDKDYESDSDSDYEEDYKEDEDYFEKKKHEEQIGEMQKKMKKMEDYQKGFCPKCGAKLPTSNWSSSGYGKCPNCGKGKYLTAG